jgi:enamine deaminase RidA (YjgF/YER057c/UK114 family)
MSNMKRVRIQPPGLLTPKGYPFSWGVRVQSGDLLYNSGQVSIDIDRNVIGPGDMTA